MKPQKETDKGGLVSGDPLSLDHSQKNLTTLNSGETVVIVTMSETEKEKEKEKTVRLLNDYGIGLEVSVKILKAKGIDTNKTELHRLKKRLGIKPKRVFDEKYNVEKQSYNSHLSKKLVTHALDGYGLTDGSLKRRHHARGYVRFEDEAIIKMLMIVNVKTQKRYYHVYHEPKETTVRVLQIIQKAIDNGEQIKYLRMDRKINAVINGVEALGITPIIYEKTIETPYNSPAESQFGNISKCFYSILDEFKDVDIETATQLFDSILKVYWEYDDTKLKIWKEQQIALSQRVEIPTTHKLHIPTEKEANDLIKRVTAPPNIDAIKDVIKKIEDRGNKK